MSVTASAVNLSGKRIVLTQADCFMGPVLSDVLKACGTEVISSSDSLSSAESAERLIDTSGDIDVLVVNLAIEAPQTLAADVTSSYCAARGAQISYIQAIGVEVARHNIQVNAIAQNFVDNDTCFPQAVQQNPAFQSRLKNEVPLGRLVTKNEDASFAAYLCSDSADCFVGQVFPVCGGWVGR